MAPKPLPDTRNRDRVRRYRKSRRRVDYFPGLGVAAIIEKHLAAGLDNCMAGVIDKLIRAGDMAISGNGPATDPKP
jgi:hypothetical protein